MVTGSERLEEEGAGGREEAATDRSGRGELSD